MNIEEAIRSPLVETGRAPETSQSTSRDRDSNLESQSPSNRNPQWIGLSGLLGFAAAWILARIIDVSSSSALVILFLSCTAAPMVLLSLLWHKTYRFPSSGLLSTGKGAANWERIVIKLTGLGATLLVLCLCYWLFPEYHRAHYFPLWDALALAGIPLLALIVTIFAWTDCRMENPRDGYWHAGLIALGRWKEVDPRAAKQYAFAWLVKGFFLPFMTAGAAVSLATLVTSGVDFSTVNTLYVTGVSLIYSLDVTFGAIGYYLTLRILDSHIRSTEATWGGWMCTIICYVPFSVFIWDSFLKYKGPIHWYETFLPYPVLYVSWAFAILTLLGIYVWATISFGCRFSNLTNRGVIRHGPYAFLKHPAYVAKNLAWWFISVPFLAHHTWEESLRASICLLLTNLIYALRAKTEERHMMQDPEYRAYSDWIDRHGAYAQLKRLFQRATK